MIIIFYFSTLDIFYIVILTSLCNVFVKNCLFIKQFLTICLVKGHEQFKIGSGAISNKIYYHHYYY